MPRKSSRLTQSQASSSRVLSQNTLSQIRIDEHLGNSDLSIDDLINNCVRYFVNHAGQNVYFRRADIQKFVIKRQQFQRIIEKATEILKNVYGLNVLVCDPTSNSSKAYIVSNGLPYKNYNINKEVTETKDVQQIILLLILTHIYLSNCPVPEASLYQFLKYFQIDPTIRHEVFGNVKDYIMNTLIKQKYLSMETDSVTKRITFTWGIRSEREISKHEILNFVCKMFKNCQPKSWSNEYRIACEQGFENERIGIDDQQMEVDEE